MLARRQRQESFAPASLDDLAGWFRHVEPPDVSDASNRANTIRSSGNLRELLSQPGTRVANVLKQSRITESLHDVGSHACNQGPAAECSAVVAWLDRRCDFSGYEY